MSSTYNLTSTNLCRKRVPVIYSTVMCSKICGRKSLSSKNRMFKKPRVRKVMCFKGYLIKFKNKIGLLIVYRTWSDNPYISHGKQVFQV